MFIPDPKSGRLPIAYTPSFVVGVGLEPTLRFFLPDSKSGILPIRRSHNIAVYTGFEPVSPDRQSGRITTTLIDLVVRDGIEPPLHEPKSCVLPLDDLTIKKPS